MMMMGGTVLMWWGLYIDKKSNCNEVNERQTRDMAGGQRGGSCGWFLVKSLIEWSRLVKAFQC